MSKDGFNTDDIDSIVARCSKRRRVDESNLKHKTLETGALPSATHDAGAVVLSFIADAYNCSQRSTSEDIEWSRQQMKVTDLAIMVMAIMLTA